ncbi:TetR/AcrR family transcriptional regulator C-terminal domain-containing protein [Actinomadura sp. 3N508]|uniref:TetR/AcrR family transcriptional regulator C-terminal domain-containing protein n=1 Tax=Actinomadura sp. 3N508 TaxID=3375153 RepID=UPI003790B058
MPLPPGRKRRVKAPPGRPLTVDLIVDTALQLLVSEGLDAISMRKVAKEFDTGPASLYAHVSDKDELLELLLDKIAGQVTLPEPDPDRWQEQLKDLAREIRKVWGEHKDIARAFVGRFPVGPNQLRVADTLLGVLRAGRIPPKVAVYAVDVLGRYVNAETLASTGPAFQVEPGKDPERSAQEYTARIADYLRALPPQRYPHIVDMVDQLLGQDSDQRFEFGLNLLVQSFASYAGKED